MRLLLFTGKGGVGKTSVAAATALLAADAGLRTLVLSTDPAHSLADALDLPLGSDPTAVVPRLWGQQLDAAERLEDAWGGVQAWLAQLLDWAGVDAIEAEELAVLPGLDEIFSLADIKDHAASGAWDVIIVDCGPTAETIRLLSLPDVLRWYMERVFPVERTVTKLIRPLLQRLSDLPVAGDDVFQAAVRFYGRLDGVRALLTDRDVASVRLVVNPERVVLAEARRTATYLALFGYRVDAVIANRVLPDVVTDPWFRAWKDVHAGHLAAIHDEFDPIPVLRADLVGAELVGVDHLRSFGRHLYSAVEPTAVLHTGDLLTLAADGDERVLDVPLPFVDRDELEVGRSDEDLLVRVGPHRRAICLPDSLRGRSVVSANLDGDRLRVRFGHHGQGEVP
ncbi:MAG TPA: ArsA family ATPase [Acidimicrobiales bacterium]